DNPSLSDDDNALQQFEKTVSKKGNRYEVGWPWKGDEKTLTNNYGLSMGRLKTLLKRLRTDETLFERYDETITKQEELGIIERADHFIPQHRPVYYIPHQPVITPFKATTKLRVVYDASSKASKKEVSLNEAIFRGPPILPQLCGMLLRFRLSPIIITADIEKAFLQVSLREEDRDTTRFLWVKDRKYDVSKNN
ncbi:unnamed protein product, partial [Anisakis simplex]|uniref:DUF1758 domain-containing protein n=1 Tax=Anisakis simplex TaxID=6269 RepID=A0A0M3JN63_ANISI